MINACSMGIVDILGTTLQWLNYRGVRNTSLIKSKVLRIISNYRRFSLERAGENCVCRHFLMDVVSIFVPPRLRGDFVEEFCKVYDAID